MAGAGQVLNDSSMSLIVTPIANILGTIRENAQHVIKALDMDDVSLLAPSQSMVKEYMHTPITQPTHGDINQLLGPNLLQKTVLRVWWLSSV